VRGVVSSLDAADRSANKGRFLAAPKGTTGSAEPDTAGDLIRAQRCRLSPAASREGRALAMWSWKDMSVASAGSSFEVSHHVAHP
jgi:hypothetical protein